MSLSDMLYKNLLIRISLEAEPRDSEALLADWHESVKITLHNFVMRNLFSLSLCLNLTSFRSEFSNESGQGIFVQLEASVRDGRMTLESNRRRTVVEFLSEGSQG
jgi:hypothetical protein